MNHDEIIAMAKEAGRYASHQTGETGEWNIVRDLRFAALVAAAEREACAQVCDRFAEGVLAAQAGPDNELANVMLRQVAVLGHGECAAAIRARGNT